MSCIKLLPLPPPRGRYWPVGGFQQWGVCVLSSCCSLSVAQLFFVLRVSLHVSFDGIVEAGPGAWAVTTKILLDHVVVAVWIWLNGE